VTDDYPEFQGTPTFLINGTLLKNTANWDGLEPQLKAALGG
jgi:protein-disulfide isomerase